MSGFPQGFGDVRRRMAQGFAGEWVETSHHNVSMSGLNASPQSRQITTIDVAVAGDNEDQVITVDNVAVTVSTGVGLSADQIGAELVAGIDAEPLVRGKVIPTYAGGVLTLSAKLPAMTFPVTAAGTTLSNLATIASAAAEPVEFGRAIISLGYDTGPEPEQLVSTCKASRFTPQVTSVVGWVAAAPSTVRIVEIRGEDRTVLAYVQTAGTLADAATINAALPADTVEVVAAGADLVFTAEIAGLEFALEAEGAGPIASTPVTGPSEATSLGRAFLGISRYSTAEETAEIGGERARYEPNAGVGIAVSGPVYVDSLETVTAGSQVYVETADTADAGKLYTAPSATRLALPRSRITWLRSARDSRDQIAAVRVSGR